MDDEYKEGITAKVVNISTGRLAKATRRTKDAAKLWKRGERVPSATTLINLARVFPEIDVWVRQQIAHGQPQADSPQMLDGMMREFQRLVVEDSQDGAKMREILRRRMAQD